MNHSVPNPIRLSAMLLMMALAAVSCGPRPVILDTDWWTDVDDAMAVRLATRKGCPRAVADKVLMISH